MHDALVTFITQYQSDPLHGPCEIRFPTRAIELNAVGSSDKVGYWATPQGPPTILTINDAVTAFLGSDK